MSLPEIAESLDWYDKLTPQGRHAFVVGVVGTLGCIGLFYGLLRKWLGGKSATAIRELKTKMRELEAENARLKRNPEKAELERLHRKFDELTGPLWFNQQAPAPVPPFIPLVKRRTRIVSVFNLKGGVGKTTITANLAAVISRRQSAPRILVIDADWQGSLTALCTESRAQLTALMQDRKLLHRIIEAGQGPENPYDVLYHVGENHLPNTRLLGADGTLSQVEDATLVRWVAERLKHDPRFVLREWLHSDAISKKFDLVLIDCPPRLTAASVAALAASDDLLIPVIPDDVSASAVTKLLQWLQTHASDVASLKSARIIPNLARLGPTGLIQNHRAELAALAVDATHAWGQAVELLMDCCIHPFTAPDMNRPFPGLGSQAETFRRLAEKIHPSPPP